jgi:hypothetical protein
MRRFNITDQSFVKFQEIITTGKKLNPIIASSDDMYHAGSRQYSRNTCHVVLDQQEMCHMARD